MSVRAVAAVPAAPSPRPDGTFASPRSEGAVGELMRAALFGTVDVETRVLLTAGRGGVVHDRAVVTTRREAAGAGDGPAHRGEPFDLEVAVDAALMAAVAGRTGFSRGRTDELGGDLAELVRWCAEVAPDGLVLPVELPENAGVRTLEAVATGLRAAADMTPRSVAVVAAGDLAGSVLDGGPDGVEPSVAEAFDEQALAALRAGDPEALGALGPRRARTVGARGWAPLTVVCLLADMIGLEAATVRYLVEGSRGRVVIGP